jgi:hypothetical protein
VSTIVAALRAAIGENQMTAYLVEMAVRLVELRRVLKPTGSLYLHCDATAGHYLKVVLTKAGLLRRVQAGRLCQIAPWLHTTNTTEEITWLVPPRWLAHWASGLLA